MDGQLPDIGNTITNNILHSTYLEIQSFCRSAVVGYFRTFPYRVALFLWIRIGLYIVGKIRFNRMNDVGQVLNYNFNRTNPQWRRQCTIIITQKNTCLTSGSTNITQFFLLVMCELKLAQLKSANTLSMNPSIGGEGRVCMIAKWWDLGWNLAFCKRSD